MSLKCLYIGFLSNPLSAAEELSPLTEVSSFHSALDLLFATMYLLSVPNRRGHIHLTQCTASIEKVTSFV